MLKRVLFLTFILMISHLPALQIQEVAQIETPELIPDPVIYCCDNCEQCFESKGLMLIDSILIQIYNKGNVQSSPANGKVEFFDLFSNSQKTFNFSVSSIPAKKSIDASPLSIKGPFLIKKTSGITVKVTFKKSGPLPATNSKTFNSCHCVD